ncbi:MAG: hypothetical protein R3182_01490 [Draconibacterium sp.]|nr:hypothetical protein [Draconibacterium sp.]
MKRIVKEITAGLIIALLLVTGNLNAKATELKASSHENFEISLDLENWMTDENIWSSNSLYSFDFDLEAEPALELENWMTCNNTWEMNNMFYTESETDLGLETWMTSDNLWDIKETTHEDAMEVENWMIDDKVW